MILSKNQIKKIVLMTIQEGYGLRLGRLTPSEQRSVDLMKRKVDRMLEDYESSKYETQHSLEFYTQYRQEEEDREIDPYDPDAKPKDLDAIDRMIDKVRRRLETYTDVIRISFPKDSIFWRDVEAKPRVIKAMSWWLANEKKVNASWVSNELLVVDITRKPGQRLSRSAASRRGRQ